MSASFDPSQIVVTLFQQTDLMLNNYTQEGYQALVHVIELPLASAAVLYVAFLGLGISQGWTTLSLGNLSKAILTIGLLFTFAMNWGFFEHYAVAFINDAVNEVSDTMMNVGNPDIRHAVGGGIDHGLQVLFNRITNWGAAYSHHGVSGIFEGILIYLFGGFVIGLGCLEILVAKALLSILFALAPALLGMTLFKPTHGIFDRWVGEITGNAMVIIMVSSAVGLAIVMMSWVFPDTIPDDIGFSDCIAPILLCIVSTGLIFRAATVGHQIGGAVTGASAQMTIAAGIGAAVATATALNSAKNATGKIAGSVWGTSKQAGERAISAVQSMRNRWRNRRPAS